MMVVGALDQGVPLEKSAESKLENQNHQTDGQTDRCLIVRAPQTAVGHHCRVLGLIEGSWGNITRGGGGTAAAVANY